MEEQAEAQLANHHYKHVRAHYDVDGTNGDPYLYYSAQVSFVFAKADFIKMPDNEHIKIHGNDYTLGKAIKNASMT